VILAAGPLAKHTVSIMIQNNSATPLKLSEPTVDTKEIAVKLAEPNPGRSFTATLDIPEGFKLAEGAKAEFSVKSDNPRHPLLKVPITQMPKPIATPVAPHPTIVPLTPTPIAPPTPPASASTSKPTAQ
jgi:hypothetical protein